MPVFDGVLKGGISSNKTLSGLLKSDSAITATLRNDSILKGAVKSSISVSGALANPALRGYSAYEIAVLNGFQGTEQEWLDSLQEIISEEDKQKLKDEIMNSFKNVLDQKVDKKEGFGLVENTEIAKLTTVVRGANKTSEPEEHGNGWLKVEEVGPSGPESREFQVYNLEEDLNDPDGPFSEFVKNEDKVLLDGGTSIEIK